MKYLVVQRRDAIKTLLVEKGSVTINEVSELFDVSIETVRRDFDALAEEGFLNKIYGGASLRNLTTTSLPTTLLSNTFSAGKTRVAARAARMIKNNDAIFLDSSDTVLRMCNDLMDKEITVLTNSLRVVEKLSSSKSVRLMCVGGTFSPEREEFYGAVALETLQKFHFDRAFITCRSISFDHGIGTGDMEQALLKKTIIAHARQVNLLTYQACFDRFSFAQFADFEDIHNIFTDKALSPQWRDFLGSKSVSCYECTEDVPLQTESAQ